MRQRVDGGAKKRRLFVAIEVDDGIRAQLERAANRLGALGVSGRVVTRDNYHITVAFLGYVDPSVIPRLGEMLRATGAALAPLRIELERIGAFPNTRRPRVVWAGPHRPNAQFAALVQAVWDALEVFGFGPDRIGDAHVTLCRCERDARSLPQIDFAPRSVDVRALTLFESHLSREGARYVVLGTFPLGKDEASEPGASTR